MESKMIDFGQGIMLKGFSEHLNSCFDLVSIDIYTTPDFREGTLPLFFSEGEYYLVKAKGKELINYRELGRYELLDAIFSKGDYLHSFYIAENAFINKKGRNVKLIALLYEERGNIHIWNPFFEELFLPLINDDLDKGVDSHWRSIQEIHLNRALDLNVFDICLQNQVDYEIEECIDSLGLTTTVLYALINHIFLVEDQKYPAIPGSDRTLVAFNDLYDDYLHGQVDMNKWRGKYWLSNPWE